MVDHLSLFMASRFLSPFVWTLPLPAFFSLTFLLISFPLLTCHTLYFIIWSKLSLTFAIIHNIIVVASYTCVSKYANLQINNSSCSRLSVPPSPPEPQSVNWNILQLLSLLLRLHQYFLRVFIFFIFCFYFIFFALLNFFFF